jgi:hypothetical protein
MSKFMNDEEAKETLKGIAVDHAIQFLKREEVAPEEEEVAFAGYCCGFFDGFQKGVESVIRVKKSDESKAN